MAADRQLTRDFWLHEFPGWQRATEEQVAALQETAARVLQPIRSAMGVPVRPSSWLWWSSGEPRTGSHSHPGTVDFVVDDGLTETAHDWATRELLHGGYIGRLIYEPERTAAEGRPQGEHIHMAPRAAMLEAFGPEQGAIQSLVELEEGRYAIYRAAATVGLGAAALVAGWLYLASRRPLATG